MIEITNAFPPEHRLQTGDVVMVRRTLRDKDTNKPFDWRYFAVVTRVDRVDRLRAMMHLILDEKDRQPTTLWLIKPKEEQQVWYLPEEEWPDGVYAFRTKAILEGRVDAIV
jgi:hypothetical protein